MPVSAAYRPDPRMPELGAAFFDPVRAAEFPQRILRFRNDRAAATVGLDGLTDEAWTAAFGDRRLVNPILRQKFVFSALKLCYIVARKC